MFNNVVLFVLFIVIKNDLWLFLLPAVFAVLLLALFMEEIGFFLRHVPSQRRRNLSLWILGIYPVQQHLLTQFIHFTPLVTFW